MLKWIRKNLFATVLDSLVTLTIVALLAWLVPKILGWALFDANFVGVTREDCKSGGACWVFIGQRWRQFIYGFYPEDQLWRVNLSFAVLIAWSGLALVRSFRWRKYVVLSLVTVFPLLAFALLLGGAPTAKWGGLMLTLIIALVGIAFSLPAGILLALGRRSNPPIIKGLCVAFIELWRGVPLISVLFMASVMLPLTLPEGVNFDKLLRALVGVSLFSSAYMAEVVRGGLQAIPKGQFEAAHALALSYWQAQRLIILPQALRHVIPGIVNSFISLVKDTTLVLIIGMFDLLGIVQATLTDPAWLGYATEGYLFAGAIFWILCFTMSRASARLEHRLAHSGRTA